jgi:LPS sulfotransferase NodH
MNNNIPQQLELIWDVLHMYNEQCLDPHHEEYDELWGDICTAMANVTEALGYDLNDDGDYEKVA